MTTNDVTYELAQRAAEQTAASLARKRDEQRRVDEWPGQVNKLLASLAGKAVTHDQQLAAIDARLAKLEAAVGLAKG